MSYCSFFIRGFDLKTYPAAIDFDDRRFAHHLFTDGCCLGMLYMNFNTYGICIRFQHAFQAVSLGPTMISCVYDFPVSNIGFDLKFMVKILR